MGSIPPTENHPAEKAIRSAVVDALSFQKPDSIQMFNAARIRYCVELDQVKDIQGYNRIRGEARFFLLKEFFDKLEPAEKARLGEAYRRKKTLADFCREKGVGLTSFCRWQRRYKQFGILGLIPKYGNRGQPHDRKPWEIEAVIAIDPLRPLSCLRGLLDTIRNTPAIPADRAEVAIRYLQKELGRVRKNPPLSLARPLTQDERQLLLAYKSKTHVNHRAKAQALLMADENKTLKEVANAVGRSTGTIYRWLRLFNQRGLDFIETKCNPARRQQILREMTIRVVDILHKSPNLYGINRATWTLKALQDVYFRQFSEKVSSHRLHQILREQHYSWRHARKVLTSPDPEYREKLSKVLGALHGLKPGDAFFFIDEAGPWRVKKYGGKSLTRQGEIRTVPEFQPHKGAIHLIAALEALSNQVTWEFITGKNAGAIVMILEKIIRKYSGFSRLCVTWDSLSSHNSAMVGNWIAAANARSLEGEGPRIEVYPLPSNAQFLNVVESTFGQLRRAVIHNSNYASKEEMQRAIELYFEEHNAHFEKYPRRAGSKIWNPEFKIDELPGGLFRRM